MAFSYTRNTEEKPFGGAKLVFGTYTNSGSTTGGDISTGLSTVLAVYLQTTSSSVATNAPAVNESFPLTGGDVTIITDAGGDGVWMALGI